MYDFIIIGGGISGLYCVQELYKKNKNLKILILDDRNYWGGRIITHYEPFYEIGAARFNDNHKLFLSLIKEYKCHKIPLSSEILFLHETKNKDIIPYYNVGETLSKIMSNIIKKSKSYPKSKIQQYSLKSWIDYLSKDVILSKKIKDIFGYDSEINEMNAYDALLSFENDFISNHFYILKEGLTNLCLAIYKKYKDKVDFQLNTFITNIQKQDKSFILYDKKNKQYECNKIIIATKAEQIKQFSILKNIFPLISCIYSAPLLRIYAKYPLEKNKVWFHELPRIITNNHLRQIIPIDYKKGLIMISYTDGHDIGVFWKDKRKRIIKSESKIKIIIQNELKVLFPNIKIPKPTYFNAHLWTHGCHHWKPNCDSTKVAKQIQYPQKNIYIVGEAFSHKQAWMEGALESVEEIMKKL